VPSSAPSFRFNQIVLVFSLIFVAQGGANPLCSDDRKLDWVKVADKAGWQPRDSSGEAVFKDRLWLLGGWFDSFAAPPRDVWNSADGKEWKLVTREAPWKYSDLPMTLVHRDRMWFLGGWYNGRLAGHGATSEVWSSADGEKWDQATPKAGWSPRIAAGAVVFKDRMWILGGTENYYFGDDTSLTNDVWSSADGVDWKRETASAPWSPRAYHAAVVHDGRIWVLGGGNYVPRYHAKNDVWSSADGVHWERATESAPWDARLWFSAVAYRDRLWVLGGWSNNPSKNHGDVWHSRDGKTWERLQSNVCWKERHEHSAYVFQDKLWVAGGHAQPLSSEVWSLDVPKDWFAAPREPAR
jgi:Kelch motif